MKAAADNGGDGDKKKREILGLQRGGRQLQKQGRITPSLPEHGDQKAKERVRNAFILQILIMIVEVWMYRAQESTQSMRSSHKDPPHDLVGNR